jgi:hypothetical protein
MKVEQSSAEFGINNQFSHAYFGFPLVPIVRREDGICEMTFPTGVRKHWSDVSRPISKEDIGKLNMWDNYREEINGMYQQDSTSIAKDKFGQYWICMGGTGWAANWTVGLGTLESGKYPV